MATSKSQRIGIWIIVVFLVVGTLGGFLAMILQPSNDAADAAKQQAEYEKQLAEFTKQQEEARKANRPLDGYEATPFDKASVTELQVETLVQGEGAEVKADSTILANYFGWTFDGKIFDSTKKEGKEVAPVEFPLTGVITGWTEGLTGVKVGSIVRLTIPADKAYGDKDNGYGNPYGPLKFIVEVKELK